MEPVILNKENKVAEVVLNRPEVHNAINLDLIKALSKALDECWKDDNVKVVVLRGEGESFSSGADLRQFMDFAKGKGNVAEYALKLHYDVIKKMRDLPKPIIAKVHGFAIGAGLGLVVASDYAIAAESSVFSCGYIMIGLSPDTGTSFFIPRSCGIKRAFELMSSGRRFSAKEAFEYGLITEVVPDSELDRRVEEVVEMYLNRPRKALEYLKKLMNVTFSNTLEEHLSLEMNLAMISAMSKDFVEGVSAMLEKREPRFD